MEGARLSLERSFAILLFLLCAAIATGQELGDIENVPIFFSNPEVEYKPFHYVPACLGCDEGLWTFRSKTTRVEECANEAKKIGANMFKMDSTGCFTSSELLSTFKKSLSSEFDENTVFIKTSCSEPRLANLDAIPAITEINLSWNVLDECNSTYRFMVEWRNNSQVTDLTSFTIKNLKPLTAYTVRVTPVDRMGVKFGDTAMRVVMTQSDLLVDASKIKPLPEIKLPTDNNQIPVKRYARETRSVTHKAPYFDFDPIAAPRTEYQNLGSFSVPQPHPNLYPNVLRDTFPVSQTLPDLYPISQPDILRNPGSFPTLPPLPNMMPDARVSQSRSSESFENIKEKNQDFNSNLQSSTSSIKPNSYPSLRSDSHITPISAKNSNPLRELTENSMFQPKVDYIPNMKPKFKDEPGMINQFMMNPPSYPKFKEDPNLKEMLEKVQNMKLHHLENSNNQMKIPQIPSNPDVKSTIVRLQGPRQTSINGLKLRNPVYQNSTYVSYSLMDALEATFPDHTFSFQTDPNSNFIMVREPNASVSFVQNVNFTFNYGQLEFNVDLFQIDPNLDSDAKSGDGEDDGFDDPVCDVECTDQVVLSNVTHQVQSPGSSIVLSWQTEANCHESLMYLVEWEGMSSLSCTNSFQIINLERCSPLTVKITPVKSDINTTGDAVELNIPIGLELDGRYISVHPDYSTAYVSWNILDACSVIHEYRLHWGEEFVDVGPESTEYFLENLLCNKQIALSVAVLDGQKEIIETPLQTNFKVPIRDPEFTLVRLSSDGPEIHGSLDFDDPCQIAKQYSVTIGEYSEQNNVTERSVQISTENLNPCSDYDVGISLLDENSNVVMSVTQVVRTLSSKPTIKEIRTTPGLSEISFEVDVEHDGCQVPSRAEITYNGIASEGIYIEGSFNYVLRNLDCRTSYVVVIELRGNKGELLDSYQVESATSEGDGVTDLQVSYYFAHLKVSWKSDYGICATPDRFQITLTSSDGTTNTYTTANTETEIFIPRRQCSNVVVAVEKLDADGQTFAFATSYTTPLLESTGAACDSNEVNVNVCNGCLRVLRHLNIRYGDSMTLCKQQDTRFDRLTVGSLEEYHTMISFLRDDQKLHEDPKNQHFWVDILQQQGKGFVWRDTNYVVYYNASQWHGWPQAGNIYAIYLRPQQDYKFQTVRLRYARASGVLCHYLYTIQ